MSTLHCSQESQISVGTAQMLSPNLQKSFSVIGTEKWNRVMTVSVGYPGIRIPGTEKTEIRVKFHIWGCISFLQHTPTHTLGRLKIFCRESGPSDFFDLFYASEKHMLYQPEVQGYWYGCTVFIPIDIFVKLFIFKGFQGSTLIPILFGSMNSD